MVNKRLLHAAQTVLTKPVTLQGTEIVESDTVNAEVEDFKLFGRSTQDGVPSPENPIEIESVGKLNADTGKYEIEVCVNGKNLFGYREFTIKKNTGFNEETGELIYHPGRNAVCDYIRVKPHTLYNIHKVGTNTTYNEFSICIYDAEKKFIRFLRKYYRYLSIKTGTDGHYLRFSFMSVDAKKIQLEEGLKETPYEPYRKPQTVIIELDEPLRGLPDASIDMVYMDRKSGKAFVERRVGYIESYRGESVGDIYMSSTGVLTDGSAVIYPLATPIIEELPPETTAQFLSLHSNYPTTIITNSEGTDMEVTLKSLKIIGGV